jgi:hypothetical protein
MFAIECTVRCVVCMYAAGTVCTRQAVTFAGMVWWLDAVTSCVEWTAAKIAIRHPARPPQLERNCHDSTCKHEHPASMLAAHNVCKRLQHRV